MHHIACSIATHHGRYTIVVAAYPPSRWSLISATATFKLYIVRHTVCSSLWPFTLHRLPLSQWRMYGWMCGKSRDCHRCPPATSSPTGCGDTRCIHCALQLVHRLAYHLTPLVSHPFIFPSARFGLVPHPCVRVHATH